jgi:hypothetical protein
MLTTVGPSVFAAATAMTLKFSSTPAFYTNETNIKIQSPKPLGLQLTIPKNTGVLPREISIELTGGAITVGKFYLTTDRNISVSAISGSAIKIPVPTPKPPNPKAPVPSETTLSLPMVYVGIVTGAALGLNEKLTINAKAVGGTLSCSATIIVRNSGSGGGTGGGGTKPPAKPPVKPPDKPKQPDQPKTDQGSSQFRDVKTTDWFYADVEYALKHNLFNGLSADSFGPKAPMTRGMIVTVLGRLSGASESSYTGSSFSDVGPGQYYTAYVEWAKANGIVNGMGDGKFAPNGNVSRQDFAVILTRYAELAKHPIPATRQPIMFSDGAKIAGYARQAVQTLSGGGIVNGVGNNAFNPAGNATRGEVAAMLHRFIESAK